ncbi:MAG: SCP-2 sterol transfer family protein [Pseudomonadota bacterium]|nr:SCP-2 sterol transfer family protein [Pseudomonadota bacterium]
MAMIKIPVVKIPVIDLTTEPFDLLLAGLGVRMQQLAYTSPEFKALIDGRAFTLQIESHDGIARHYRIKDSKVCHRGGKAKQPDFTLRFKDSQTGVSTLTKGDPSAFMLGMQTGTIQMEGDFSLLMWFNQAAKFIAPNIPKPVQQKIKQARKFVAEKRAAFKQS